LLWPALRAHPFLLQWRRERSKASCKKGRVVLGYYIDLALRSFRRTLRSGVMVAVVGFGIGAP